MGTEYILAKQMINRTALQLSYWQPIDYFCRFLILRPKKNNYKKLCELVIVAWRGVKSDTNWSEERRQDKRKGGGVKKPGKEGKEQRRRQDEGKGGDGEKKTRIGKSKGEETRWRERKRWWKGDKDRKEQRRRGDDKRKGRVRKGKGEQMRIQDTRGKKRNKQKKRRREERARKRG